MAKSAEKSGGLGEFTKNVGELAIWIGVLALVAAGVSELAGN